MKRSAMAAIAATLALAGCVAANPTTIKPMSISPIAYQPLDCATLAAEDKRVAGELGPLIYYQRQRRGADAAGIILIGLSPTGLGSPEHSAAIGRLKGEREVIQQVKVAKGCAEPQAIVDDSTPAEERRRQIEQERHSGRQGDQTSAAATSVPPRIAPPQPPADPYMSTGPGRLNQ